MSEHEVLTGRPDRDPRGVVVARDGKRDLEAMLAVTTGGPTADDVSVGAVQQPDVHDGDVLVKVEAAGLNPYDLSLVTGLPHRTALLRPPGRDLAGTVVAGPADMIGTPVWATGGELGRDRPGSHAEYIALPRGAVRTRPDRLSAIQAATVGVVFTTAWWALTDDGADQRGQADITGHRVLVTGAAGSVGQAALQLARWLGAQAVWGFDRNASLTDGTVVIHSDPAALIDEIARAGGATVVVDTVGAPVVDLVINATAARGRIMTMATPGDGRADIDLRSLYRKGLRLNGVNTGSRDAVLDGDVLDTIRPGFQAGQLLPPHIDSLFPLTQATAAYQRLVERPHGKVVLTR